MIVPAAVCGDMETHLPISKGSDDAQGMGEKEVNLSSEEKRKLLEQYGCESDDEEYPWKGGGCYLLDRHKGTTICGGGGGGGGGDWRNLLKATVLLY